MAKLDPVIKKETTYVALWVLAACMMTQGVCVLLGWWSLSVLLGSLLGGITAVGNFLLMCLMVQKAVTQTEKQAKNTGKLSQSLRLMMQGLMLVLAAALPVFNLLRSVRSNIHCSLFIAYSSFLIKPEVIL